MYRFTSRSGVFVVTGATLRECAVEMASCLRGANGYDRIRFAEQWVDGEPLRGVQVLTVTCDREGWPSDVEGHRAGKRLYRSVWNRTRELRRQQRAV